MSSNGKHLKASYPISADWKKTKPIAFIPSFGAVSTFVFSRFFVRVFLSRQVDDAVVGSQIWGWLLGFVLMWVDCYVLLVMSFGIVGCLDLCLWLVNC